MSMMMIWTITQKKAPAFRHQISGSASCASTFGVNFVGRLRDQEQAAADQDDVAPGQRHGLHRQHRLGQTDQPHQQAEQQDTEDQCQQQAGSGAPASACAAGIRETITDSEDDVVDAVSTISSAVRVSNAAQASALVNNSIMFATI